MFCCLCFLPSLASPQFDAKILRKKAQKHQKRKRKEKSKSTAWRPCPLSQSSDLVLTASTSTARQLGALARYLPCLPNAASEHYVGAWAPRVGGSHLGRGWDSPAFGVPCLSASRSVCVCFVTFLARCPAGACGYLVITDNTPI